MLFVTLPGLPATDSPSQSHHSTIPRGETLGHLLAHLQEVRRPGRGPQPVHDLVDRTHQVGTLSGAVGAATIQAEMVARRIPSVGLGIVLTGAVGTAAVTTTITTAAAVATATVPAGDGLKGNVQSLVL